jgi:prepilin signal peptidase PulO-like enzyme (type II secretory pathway)
MDSFDLLSLVHAHIFSVVGAAPSMGYIAIVLLIVLGVAAAIDGQTGRVPDNILIMGAALSLFANVLLESPVFAAHRLGYALGTLFLLWALNELYYKIRKRDGFGFGDAKWTALAVMAFGVKPALYAWIVGSWLALLWIGVRRFVPQKEPAFSEDKGGAVFFLPFLYFGLLAGICFG